MRCYSLARVLATLAYAANSVASIVTSRATDILQPLDIKTFHSLNRIGSPVVSPSQKLALFTTSYYDPTENKNTAYISCLDIYNGNITRLTENTLGTFVSNPLWFDEETIGFLKKGALYKQPLYGNTVPSEVFAPPIAISNVMYRASQDMLTFVASVFPNCTMDECVLVKQRNAMRTDSAMVFDNLWARHWNEWMSMEKPNVFAARLDRTGSRWSVGPETNIAAMLPHTSDPLTRWSVDDYTVSPAGDNMAFVVRPPADNMTWATNVDIYLASTKHGSRPRLLTGQMNGTASAPTFSWDGRRLAWLQMETPGYESDINRIFIYTLATRKTVAVAYDWDLSPHNLMWSRDNKSLYTVTGSKGRSLIVQIDALTGHRRELTTTGSAASIRPIDYQSLLFVHSDTDKPADIHMLNTQSQAIQQLTNTNAQTLRNVHLSKAEDFWFTGAHGDKVHGWVVRPFGFNRRTTYPLALLMHGGPQQASTQSFSHSQWNPNMYASAGFVTVVINFHGSPGYGQNFTNSVRHKWGDYPYVDLMRGVDYVTSRMRFIDKTRMVALGGSFGGYMANWINGHTDKFCALVSHDGKFSTISGYYGTDELWFPEWDLGKPWDPAGRVILEENNPERFSANFKTPTLFVQGEKDFRISSTESLGAWTMMRRRGVPARLVYFPDEDHWINRAGNSVRWHTEVLDWITKWTNTSAPYRIR
ncbi:dipeptidylpeptidase [Coemansia erecta]|nr:dipeptidylpeptidase [Coemansia erecta]